jgi:hypothetical protein
MATLHRSEAAFVVAVTLASAIALAALALGLLGDPPTVAALAALAAAGVVAAVTPRGARPPAVIAAAFTVIVAGHLAPRTVFEGVLVEARGDAELAAVLALSGIALAAGVALVHVAVFAPLAGRPAGAD